MAHPHPLEKYRLYQGHFRANFRARLPSGTRTLVILRRPQDRLISALRHLRRDPDFHPDHHLAKGRSLSDLIGDDYIMRRQQDVQTYWLAASASVDAVDEHMRANPDGDPTDVEPDMDDAALELAEHMLQSIDFVGFTENLTPVLAQLADEMDYYPAATLPVINGAREPLWGVTACPRTISPGSLPITSATRRFMSMRKLWWKPAASARCSAACGTRDTITRRRSCLPSI